MAGSYRHSTDRARNSHHSSVNKKWTRPTGHIRKKAVAPRHFYRISKVRAFWKASSMAYRHTPISFRKCSISIKKKCREVQLKIFLNEDFSKCLGSSVGVHGIFLYVDETFSKRYRCVPIGHGTGFPKRPYFWDSVKMAGSYRHSTAKNADFCVSWPKKMKNEVTLCMHRKAH